MMQKSISLYDYNFIKNLHVECEETTIEIALSENADSEIIRSLRVYENNLDAYKRRF
jgi:hypothetical protein